MSSALPKRSGYLPSLDGWRAIAILGVFAVHERPLSLFGRNLSSLQSFGSLGVVLFFAISGLLICSRILEEERLSGRFHLKLFYIRRLCRIQPAALTYLAVLAVLMGAGVVFDRWTQWRGGVLLYTNFQFVRADTLVGGPHIGHFWTLAVEEHFYLLISIVLFFVRKRRALWIGAALAVVKVVQILVKHHLTTEPLLRRTYWQIHVLLWPSLVAVLLSDRSFRAAAVRWMKPGWAFLFTAVACLAALSHSKDLLSQVLEYSFTLWVAATMLHPESLSTRALEWAPLRFLGRLSYSLYLWHVLFFFLEPGTAIPSLWFISNTGLKYVFSLTAALLSYFVIEKPMIRLGHRLAPPATAGHMDLKDTPAPPMVVVRH